MSGRKKFLTVRQLQEELANWSENEDEHDNPESSFFGLKEMVLCPPPDVGAITDEEDVDEDEMVMDDPNTMHEVAGFVEIETTADNIAGEPENAQPDEPEPQPENIIQPGPSKKKKIRRHSQVGITNAWRTSVSLNGVKGESHLNKL